jgi:hypothetical protein
MESGKIMIRDFGTVNRKYCAYISCPLACTHATERDYPVEQLSMDDPALALEHQERMQT